MNKRALLHNIPERRLAGPGDDAQWRIDPAGVEFRDNGDGFYTYRGEASVVDHPYTVRDAWGEFTETIVPGAFDVTLRNNPAVAFVYMHDMATVMASTRSGSLTLTADPHLTVDAKLDVTDQDVQRLAPKAARGDANSMSFAFRVMRQEWNEDYTDRRILEVNLNGGDVSAIVTGHGANPAAWGTLRTVDFDDLLRFLDETTLDDEQRASIVQRVGFATGGTISVNILGEERSPADLADAIIAKVNAAREVPQSIREDLAALYQISLTPAV